MSVRLTVRVALIFLLPTGVAQAQTLLHPADYHHYIQTFEADEQAATGNIYNGEPSTPGQPPEAAWPWMQREIPWFDASDKSFEEMYYFRWYAWKKHLVHAPSGYIITEWLPKPNLPDFGALPDAAPFHLDEARWLHTRAIAEDDARFWYRPDLPGPDSEFIRKYSAPMATAVYDVTLANGDTALATSLLPQLVRVYHDWERTQQDPNGLFWSIDTRDAMEKSISGDGYRPTLNSYMVSDARAIAATALLTGNQQLAADFTTKADHLNNLIETKLWNPHDQFYEVVSPAKDSGIRAQKKFIDPGTILQFSGVRELIGYDPWAYASPAPAHAVAWRQLFDPQGFDGKFGATTAERRSPRFRFASSDQCTWNGPAWPFAMTQTLTALAAYLNTPGPHTTRRQPTTTRSSPATSSPSTSPSTPPASPSRTPSTGSTKTTTPTPASGSPNPCSSPRTSRSAAATTTTTPGSPTSLITGLIGLRPRADNRIVLHPLAPASWTYFAIDALPYHGHLLTIAFDRTGTHYHHGRGLSLAVDGHTIAHRATLGPLEATLPK